MSWTRESLFAAILALSAPWAAADSLTVNTTTDDYSGNSLCSLREAVEYFNRGKPENGFQGCKSTANDSYAFITLPADKKPYLIEDGPITIRTTLSISGEGRTGDAITTVQVVGAHRAFVINHNPQYLPPRCATTAPGCATSPATFDLADDSDLGTADDYLTTLHALQFNGVLPGVTPTPPATDPPAYNYVVRVYDNPETGDPVLVGQTVVPYSSAPIPWQVTTYYLQDDKVHHFSYTLQVVDPATSTEIVPQGPQSAARVQVALYTEPARIDVQFNRMIIKGGCATAAGCAGNVDDNTNIINDPASGNAAYDEYELSYTNGLTSTAGNGGVIFSGDHLTLSDVLLQDGEATKGGGIYLGTDGVAAINTSELRANRADAGAAIYAERNVVDLETSLLTANVINVPAGSGAVLEVADATRPTAIAPTALINVTISGNTGRALSLREDARVNASTIVLNTGGGLDFNGEDVVVYNTILAGNTTNGDCENLPGTPTMEFNLVLSPGTCPTTGNQTVDDQAGTPGQLMATLVNGKCASDFGLLCPLSDRGGPTFVHMPHVLPGYGADPLLLDASPLINKGADSIGSSGNSCPSTDQRGKERVVYACDIGAVEMQGVGASEITLSGDVIKYGQTHTQYLGDDLADEELLPAVLCPTGVMLTLPPATAASLYPPPSLAPDPTRVVGGTYRADVPGCPWVERSPTRGTVTFDTDGNYIYRPSGDFHGFDTFDMRVVTSLSMLYTLPADRSHVVAARVIVEPDTTMASDKLGGAIDGAGLLLLALLGLGWRRGDQE
ncbi:MAG TPA: choice-of-anchor Q domain-containing protein [Moraxellaceae bacterium]|nr:choice-of-anchor Q domain-containing protein [Moraxellaceae bacterium]